MTRDEFREHLSGMYQTVVMGEVVFNQLLAHFDRPEQQRKLSTLLQLETETKARLRPRLVELEIPVAELEESQRLGREIAEHRKTMAWDEVMAAMRDGIAPYIERYREIEAAAPAEYRALAASMVVNEQSIHRFAERELAGDGTSSLDAVVVQLRHPLQTRGDALRALDPGWVWDRGASYSQAIETGGTVYVSGQIAVDADGTLVGPDDIRAQLRQTLANLAAVLAAGGYTMADVVKTAMFTTDIAGLLRHLDVRTEFFVEPFPANSVVEVRALATPGLLLELEGIARGRRGA